MVAAAVLTEEIHSTSDADLKKTAVENKRALPTYEEIRSAIPAQCFEKNLPLSIAYLMWDYAVIGLLYVAVPYVEQYAGWPGLLVWYYVMGMFMSSLFIIGHDCGHTTFSNYEWVNDICGHLAHAPIMAPYWPWKKSHHQHHSYTGHLEKDKGHPWVTETDWAEKDWLSRNFCKLPISGLFRRSLVRSSAYHGTRSTRSSDCPASSYGSHFWPFSPLFTNNKERLQCVVSGAACALCAYLAFTLCNFSIVAWVKYYYVPLLFQGLWMVMITYLQHQDEEIEVYEPSTWNFVKGQSQTIDRYYGFGIDTALHHISDGHVAHHFFFTKIPHYHLPEATKALREVLSAYPGAYKQRPCYATLFEFLRLNVKLDYLLGRGTGLLKYRTSKDYADKPKAQ
ncbi:Fatty acid desaturase, type 1 domain-containing protein [Aphelenchoides fujianensis]|nr:Fatty acid desaturase, type 1 domain-containing protein [Aphelenchoides fujianensis]